MVTEKPRACNNLASDEEMIPFPSDDDTPPVTKMYFTCFSMGLGRVFLSVQRNYKKKLSESNSSKFNQQVLTKKGAPYRTPLFNNK